MTDACAHIPGHSSCHAAHFSETIFGILGRCWAVTASQRKTDGGWRPFLLGDACLQPPLVFTGTAATPRWCTSWARWSPGTWPTTLRGARWKVTPRLPTCTSCTRTTCSCGGSSTPNTRCRCCSGRTGTPLSTAASLRTARRQVVRLNASITCRKFGGFVKRLCSSEGKTPSAFGWTITGKRLIRPTFFGTSLGPKMLVAAGISRRLSWVATG